MVCKSLLILKVITDPILNKASGESSGTGSAWTHLLSILNAESLLSRRIDWIPFRSQKNWDVIDAKLIGESQRDRTETRIWPSDHAGITADMKLKCC